ncbi:hypothetical protein B0H67DRAFT_578889 [Lasiosphaeris hirsuta]|uniref:Uncharacterized protein n=1 Tax=Lasiosphaeris hirsuta TaxID=260670 RepID=A0AA40AFD2_9PEZI|nr:hypothetical protein B0H67DRAFT_578889 [Lasiosphaeris hirsuta]
MWQFMRGILGSRDELAPTGGLMLSDCPQGGPEITPRGPKDARRTPRKAQEPPRKPRTTQERPRNAPSSTLHNHDTLLSPLSRFGNSGAVRSVSGGLSRSALNGYECHVWARPTTHVNVLARIQIPHFPVAMSRWRAAS